MVEAGMTPMQAIVAATSAGADYLRLRDTGTLAAGKRADFMVLEANPLDDITNTRRIAQVLVGRPPVDRTALRAALTRSLSRLFLCLPVRFFLRLTTLPFSARR